MNATLKNKNVIITGASSGIGEEAARLFAKSGANIVIGARSMNKLRSIQRELKYCGASIVPVQTDVTRLKDCRNLVRTTVNELGSIDILINNAGFTSQGNVCDIDINDLDRTIDVNFRGTVRLTKLCLPHIINSSHGRIINISSILGIIPIPTEAVYSATKFAVRAFSYALAEELDGTDVKVCIVSPGPVDTPFIMENPEKLHDLVFSTPVSSPSEIAEMILLSALDGKMERIKPMHAGILAKIGYLFPGMKKLIKPIMEKEGRKRKEKYLAGQRYDGNDNL